MKVDIKKVNKDRPLTVADIQEVNTEEMSKLLVTLTETTISLKPVNVWYKRGAGVVITLTDEGGEGFGLQDVGDVIRLFGPVDRVSHSIKVRARNWIELTIFSSGKSINRKKINLPTKPDYDNPITDVVGESPYVNKDKKATKDSEPSV